LKKHKHTEEVPQKTKDTEKQLVKATWGLVIATALLTIGTFFLYHEAVRMGEKTDSSLAFTREGLEYAKNRDSIYIAATQVEYGAWIQVQSSKYGFDASNNYINMFKLDMVNTGKTAARKVIVSHNCVDNIALIDTSKFYFTDTIGYIGSYGENTIRSRHMNISERDFYYSDKKIFFYGKITYEDIFKRPRFIKFCYRISRAYIPVPNKAIPKDELGAIFTPTNIYNDVN
jgi:hypothetical protein